MTDPRMTLDAHSTALVLVDLQTKLMPAVTQPEYLLSSARLLLRAARILGLPVVATTQYERGLGPTVDAIAELLPDSTLHLDKVNFSCFDDVRFAPLLRERLPAVRALLVAGVESHICVAGTVLGALRAGYAVQVVQDAVASRSVADGELGLRRMELAGALRTSVEMAIYELLRASGTPEFKSMLPFFKERLRP